MYPLPILIPLLLNNVLLCLSLGLLKSILSYMSITTPFLSFPLLGDLPKPGIEPESPAWQADSLLLRHLVSPNKYIPINNYFKCQQTNQRTYRLAD